MTTRAAMANPNIIMTATCQFWHGPRISRSSGPARIVTRDLSAIQKFRQRHASCPPVGGAA